MADQSFTDRLQRSLEMHSIIAKYTLPYSPGEPSPGELDLRLPAFLEKLTAVEALNNEAADAGALYALKALERETHLEHVLTAATSVLAFLRSRKKSLRSLLRGADKIVKRMRGARPKRKKAPSAEGEEPPAT